MTSWTTTADNVGSNKKGTCFAVSLPLERLSNPEIVIVLCSLRLRRRRVDSKPPARVLAWLGEVAGGASAAVLARTRQEFLVVLVQCLHERHVPARIKPMTRDGIQSAENESCGAAHGS